MGDLNDLEQVNNKIVKDTLRAERRMSDRSIRLSMQESVGSDRRKSSLWEENDRPLIYEYAMVFAAGDPEETVEEYEENGQKKKRTQQEHFAAKTFDLIRKIGPRTRHLVKEPNDPDDPEKGFTEKTIWVGADMCVETYKSRLKLNDDEKADEDNKYKHEYIFALVGMTEDEMKTWADLQKTDVLLNPDEAIRLGRKNNFPLAWKTAMKGEKPGIDN